MVKTWPYLKPWAMQRQAYYTDKNDLNTTEKNNLVYMKKVSSGKNLKK